MSKQLKTLAKEFDFNYISDYYEYIIESYINGNFSQVRKLFLNIKKSQRELFISYLLNNKESYPDYWEKILKTVTTATFNEGRKN